MGQSEQQIENNSEQQIENNKELLSAAQLEKLKLEIKELRNKSRKVTRFLSLLTIITPIFTVLLAIGGFWEGISRYNNAQKQERLSKVQNQIRTDFEQLLGFRNTKEPMSRLVFLLEDLQLLTSSPVDDEPITRIFPGGKRRITLILFRIVIEECDFTRDARDASFANYVYFNWPDYSDIYSEYVSQGNGHLIIGKYIAALRELSNRYFSHFPVIDHRDKARMFSHEFYINGAIIDRLRKAIRDRDQFKHFMEVITGFEAHIGFLSGSSDIARHEIAQHYVQEFRNILTNSIPIQQTHHKIQRNIKSNR